MCCWKNGVPIECIVTANIGIYRLVDGKAVFDLIGRGGIQKINYLINAYANA